MRPKTVDPSACRCCQARVLATGLSVCIPSDEFDSTPGPRHEPGATGELSVIRLRWMLLRRLSNYERMFECFEPRHADESRSHAFGFGSPAPCQRSGGTSWARQRASHTSRAGTPAASASSAVRLPSSGRTVSRVEHRAERRAELLGDRAAEFGELHRVRLTAWRRPRLRAGRQPRARRRAGRGPRRCGRPQRGTRARSSPCRRHRRWPLARVVPCAGRSRPPSTRRELRSRACRDRRRRR